jgi:hypothetical protein
MQCTYSFVLLSSALVVHWSVVTETLENSNCKDQRSLWKELMYVFSIRNMEIQLFIWKAVSNTPAWNQRIASLAA